MKKNLFHLQRSLIISIFLMVILLVLLGSAAVEAAPLAVESNLGPGEEVFDDLYLQGSEVLIAGHVHGMLFVVGEKIIIQATAEIDNDIFMLAKTILIEEGATIHGNLVLAGQNVVVETPIDLNVVVASGTLDMGPAANVGRNLFFGGFHFSQQKGSVIAGNLYAGCYQLVLQGNVGHNFRVKAVSVDLNGAVQGNAEIAIDASGDDEGIRIWLPYMQQLNFPDLIPTGLTVGNQAIIKGQLIYTSAKSLEENLRNLPLQGVVEHIEDTDKKQSGSEGKIIQKNPFVSRLFRMVRQLVGFLIFAAISWRFGRKYISEASQIAIRKPFKALGAGFVTALVIYLGALFFFFIIAMVSILLNIFTLNNLGLLLFFFSLAAIILVVTLFVILAMYASKFVLAYWAGGLLLKNINIQKNKEVWSLLAGILLFVLLSVIPIFGWILGVLVSLIGIGAIWFTLQSHDQAGILPDFE
jgi:hypothetical protein